MLRTSVSRVANVRVGSVLSGRLSRGLHSSALRAALTAFDMPAMSPTMTEGGIADWKLKEGDSFAPGDVLLEVETDKATIDVEAQDEGVLGRILVENGVKNIPVGKIIAILGEEGDDFSDSAIQSLIDGNAASAPAKEEAPKEEAPKEKEETKETPKVSSSESSSAATTITSGTILATPIVKRLALERGIPLSKIKGSGPNGRIIKADIESYKPEAAATPASSSAPAPSAAPASTAAYKDVPVSSIRKVIASRLTESKNASPHFYLTVEIELDKVNKLRALFNDAAAKASQGIKSDVKPPSSKLSVNDFIVRAAALALQDVPEVNAGWHGDFIRQYATSDISVAVATPTGLITPIIRGAESKGLGALSAEAKSLAALARDGKLAPEQYQGGSFTVSNLGMFGISHFTAIINPPQGAILAVGAATQKLVLDPQSDKGFKEVSVANFTLSCDHRVIDGAVGAKWLQSFKAYLESPLSFIL